MHANPRPSAHVVSASSQWLPRLVAFVATACEPPPPPDGRDLGVTLEGLLPTAVIEGQQITVTGAVTNHGSAPASAVKVTYVVSNGFAIDDLSVNVARLRSQHSGIHVRPRRRARSTVHGLVRCPRHRRICF